MRYQKGSDGKCAVLDKAPPLFVENCTAVNLYFEARKSAESREIKAGSSMYQSMLFIRAADLNALMSIMGVEEAERVKTYNKVMLLQNTANELSPVRSL